MKKKLYCSPDKKICGVCGGIADYFGVDPTFVRLIFAEIAFFTALLPAFIIYLVIAVVIPQAPADYAPENNAKRMTKSNDKKIAGVCGGIAEYFGIDSTIVRLVFVLLFVLAGNGLYTYIFGAIFMPQPLQTATAQDYAPYGYHDAAGYSDPNAYPQNGAAADPNAYGNANDVPPQQ